MISLNSNVLKRALIAITLLFNIILVGITIHNLAGGLTFMDSYVGVSYLLVILSILSILIICVISALNGYRPGWSDFDITLELIWVSLVTLFQLISAATLSGTSVTSQCAGGAPVLSTKKHNICPSHSAILGFSWMTFINLLVHLGLIILTLLRISSQSSLSVLAVLTTQTSKLPSSSAPERTDLEKIVTASSWSSTTSSRRKQPPPPLNLAKISSSSLPIFAAHAKTVQPAVPPKQISKPGQLHPRPRNHSEPSNDFPPVAGASRLSRHQIMREVQQQYPPGHVHYDGLSPTSSLSHRQRSASLGSPTMEPWQPPQEWDSSILAGRQQRRRPSLPESSADKNLPAIPPVAAEGGSILNRPDPRHRRPSGPGELQGGFWVANARSRDSWA